MAEMIGMLGSGGFVAMVLGTYLGDFLLGTRTIQADQIRRMFVAAGVLATVAMLFAWMASLGTPRPTRRRRPPMLR